MIDFKGAHYPKPVILLAEFFHLHYPVFYRDLKEIVQERCDKLADRGYFRRAIGDAGVPDLIVNDKSVANNWAGLEVVNVTLKFTGTEQTNTILQIKCLNSILKQDQNFIRDITGRMLSLRRFIQPQQRLMDSSPPT